MKLMLPLCFAWMLSGMILLHSASASPGNNDQAFVYIVNSNDNSYNQDASTISRYRISENGSLVLLETFSVPMESAVEHGAMDPTGHFFYITQPTAGSIICYQTTSDGALTLQGSTTTHVEGYPESISFDPSGRFAYVKDFRVLFHSPNGGDAAPGFRDLPYSRIWQYRIASDGSLTPLTPAFAEAEEKAPGQLHFARQGRFAYLAHTAYLNHEYRMCQYRVNSNGTLTALSPPAVPAPRMPTFTVDPLDRFVYVPDFQQYHRICRYAIGEDGGLTALPAIPVPAGCSGREIHIDPVGKFAYIEQDASESEIVPGKKYPVYHYYLYQYRIEADGSFLPLNPPRIETVQGPHAIGFDPSGQWMYCASWLNQVSQYRILPSGTLQAVTTAAMPIPFTSERAVIVVRRSPR